VKGFVLNKFRGDAALLEPAPALLAERTGVPIIGVAPYLPDLLLPEEDAASLNPLTTETALLEIAAVRLPHLANFDEFGALAADPCVHLRWATRLHELRAPRPGDPARI
jgi:adenosylcobyric acid synthase